MRRAAKVDLNHPEIVDTYRKCGILVASLAGIGRGMPDLLVCFKDRFALVEVKQPKGKLRPLQEAFRKVWPVRIVRSVDEAALHAAELRLK